MKTAKRIMSGFPEKKEERQKYSKTVKFQSPFSKYFLSIEITDAGYVKDFSFP